MFFILSKTLYYFAMPFTWILIAIAFAYWRRRHPQKRKRWIRIAIVLFLIFTNQFLSNSILSHWEWEALPMTQTPMVEVGILLGGMTNQDRELRDRTYFTGNVDRMIQTAHLYKEGRIQKILVTGGTAALKVEANDKPEALLLKETLVEWGVPAEDIWVEDQSLNTHQNAALSKTILETHNHTGPSLLITSAFHMRRSIACFDKEGIEVVPYPTSFYTKESDFFILDAIFPKAEAAFQWHFVIREWVGYAVYRLVGYI